jgi:peptide deformylase
MSDDLRVTHEGSLGPEDPGENAAQEAQLDPQTAARRRAALGRVRQWGDPVLTTKARSVDTFDEGLRSEIREMGELMNDALGVGLAAPQLGVLHRVLVYRVEGDSPVRALVNPDLQWNSREQRIVEAGCLSLPGISVEVERPLHIRVRARDETGDVVIVEASGLEARVIQHEMDHLDGVLILDRTTREQRKSAVRTLREGLDRPGRLI